MDVAWPLLMRACSVCVLEIVLRICMHELIDMNEILTKRRVIPCTGCGGHPGAEHIFRDVKSMKTDGLEINPGAFERCLGVTVDVPGCY